MAYHQRNPSLHTNMNSQLDVGHVYRQARPPAPGPGPPGHPRPMYAPASYQTGPVSQRFTGPTPNYVQYREGPPHAYRQQQLPMPHDTGQSVKMIRIHDPKPDLQQPLRIDIREPSTAYTPQVENISPTGNDEDDAVRATKEDLLQQIGKVDREIAHTEQKIAQLKGQQSELESKSSRPEGEKTSEKEADLHIAKGKHQSLAQKIYADTRKKSAESHRVFDSLGPKIEVPIYNQPSDAPEFQDNQRKHVIFRPQLIKHLQRKAAERHEYEHQMTVTYNQLMFDWQKKAEKLEKKKPKESKMREEFEKMFPELRKQREDKERFNRVGARVKSEADMEEIMDGLHEQEMEDKKMRSYAVVPPMMLDPATRKCRYKNTNGIIHDLARLYKDSEFLNLWHAEEHDTFKKKYMEHPKNFGFIATCLEKKSVKDCVLHYYLTKKQEHYKQQLRKSRHGRTRASRNPPATKAAPVTAADAPSGVTTRLQREQLQKQDAGPPAGPLVSAVPGPTVPAIAPTSPEPVPAVPLPAPIPPAPPVALPPTEPTPPPPALPVEMEITPDPGKKRRKGGEKAIDDMESSDDETQIPTGAPIGPHCCFVCKNLVESPSQSRHLPRNHAHQYGLPEADILPGSRVCNTCHCKAVRSRLVCPLPTCPNAKGLVKRLRTIPSKWADMPPDVLEPIVRDYQIPTGTTKCCSTCYSRISRRIAPHLAPGDDSLRWPDQDVEALKTALRKHGTGWSLVAELVPGRTRHQCKTFYFNCRKKYKLDAIVHEYYKTHFGEDRKPAVTDEEESGSSTSSCDEQPDAGPDTSDTASAGSPAKHNESPMVSLSKEHRPHAIQEANDQPGELYAHLPGTSISAVPASMSPPRTVVDLMENIIEKQLMKSPGGVALGCSGPPTITSILSTDATGFKRSVGESLATLSVVGQTAQQDFQKEQNPNVVVLSIAPQGDRTVDNETLDLSMKKRDVTVEYAPSTNSVPHHQYAAPVHSKNSTVPQRETHYYHPQANQQMSIQTPHLVMTQRAQLTVKDPPGMPKLSPKVLSSSHSTKPGSITHGTPVQSSPRFENVVRQIPQSQHKEGGSITHGTPVHHHMMSDKRQNVAYDHYKRSSPATSSASSFPSPHPSARDPPSKPLSHNEQVLLQDFRTAQEMPHERRRMVFSDSSDTRLMTQLYMTPPGAMYLPSRSPAESASTPPLRQGVIQRHNTIPVSQSQPRSHGQLTRKVHYPPPGHEAFSSLVEAAVQQPSLPVPNEKKSQYHEGLGKTMADSISSSRIMGHNRMAGYVQAEQQQRIRQSQERDRIMSQREQEQRYQQAAREQRESHHHQMQMQIQRQARIEQQNQQARLEQQARMEQQQRMENARHEQQGPPRLDYEAKQQRHQQQLAAFMDAQHRATGERERERNREWERTDGSRIMMGSYPRERLLPPQRISDSPSPVNRGPSTPGTAKSGPRSDGDSTMTAASLIDAIITHQINQNSETGGPGSQTGPSQPRPGDRLFQGFPPPHAEANGKVSPLKRSASPAEPVKNISLSEHIIDSMMSKDFASPGSYPHQYQFPPQDEQQNWKMRRPESKEQDVPREKSDERQIIRMAQPQTQPSGSKPYHEPVSPPEQWPTSGPRYHERPSHLSPLDYVKSRIVEAMRTSEEKDGDEKGKDSGSPPESHGEEEPRKPPGESMPPSSSAFAFPYSTIGVHGVCVQASKPPADEPAPILSSKYEVLSDEDE